MASEVPDTSDRNKYQSNSHGGKRSGAGRVNRWGNGVKTQTYRLPTSIGGNADEIVSELELIKHILDRWQHRVSESKGKSAEGKPSERYKYVDQLLDDLQQAMKVTGKNLV